MNNLELIFIRQLKKVSGVKLFNIIVIDGAVGNGIETEGGIIDRVGVV